MSDPVSQPVINQIATTGDGKDITRGFLTALPLLPSQDELLMMKSGGNYKIYKQVLRDEEVKTCFQQRVSAVISKTWEVRPGGTKLQDKKAAEFIEQQLRNIRFDNITEKMLYGVFYGYAVAEAMWAIEGNQVILQNVIVRDRVRFAFAPDMTLRMKTMQHPNGELLPERKFWYFCTGADHDDEPYGLGLAHWLYWPVFFKRNGIQFWLTFLEKFGTPTAHGKYPSGTHESEQDKLLASLQAIQQDSAIVTPDNMVVELLEATRSGTADYSELLDKMNAAIAKVTIGQTASTQGTPGKLGDEKLRGDVRQDIIKADADLVCMSFNATIVKWLIDWNFPGAAYPQVWRVIEEPEDLNTRAERDKKISDTGFKPTLAYINETYGGEWVEATPTASIIQTQDTGAMPAFAEGDQTPTQSIEDQLASALADTNRAIVDKVVKAVNESASFAEMQQALLKQLDGFSPDDLVRVMEAAFALAELKGMADAQDEANAANGA